MGRTLLLMTVLVLVTGCGARWNEEQRALMTSRGDQQATPVDAAPTPGSPTSGAGQTSHSPSEGAGNTSPSGAADPAAPSDAGSDSPAEPGQSEPAALPCAAPSQAPGVTDDEIAVGSISSLSGPVPGLSGSAASAARAYVQYRNATGGVCGRKIVLKEADDGTDNGRYRSVLSEMEPNVLGIAGGFAFGDTGGADVIEQTRIPIVNIPSAPSLEKIPSQFDVNPSYANPDTVIGKYRYLREQGARKVSLTYIAVDQSRAEGKIQQRLMEAAGLEVVQVQELPLSTLSYDSAARSVANSGADYLLFIGDTNGNASMARSMANTGYELKFEEYFVFSFGTNFIEQAGDASEGTMTWLRTLPHIDAGKNEEVAAFSEWMDRVAPGDPKDAFAGDSWVAAKAFFDTLEALPGPISREALVNQLASVGTYDAGGMLGPIELGAKANGGCALGMHVKGGEWVRMAPAEGFLC